MGGLRKMSYLKVPSVGSLGELTRGKVRTTGLGIVPWAKSLVHHTCPAHGHVTNRILSSFEGH